jgi:hypothetical protein
VDGFGPIARRGRQIGQETTPAAASPPMASAITSASAAILPATVLLFV